MTFSRFVFVLAAALLGALQTPVAAQIVYTPVNVSIPVGGSYYLDVNHDGITDFTIRSQILQDECQFGDGYVWNLQRHSRTWRCRGGDDTRICRGPSTRCANRL